MKRSKILGVLVFLAVPILRSADAISDEQLWKHFAGWSQTVAMLPPGQHVPMRTVYVEQLVKEGVPKQEAESRFDRMSVIRRGSAEREAIYWNASFKLGGGPQDPLRLLQESVRKTKPGKALDAGMGRGRNSIFLASIGWDVTGYDMAPDALKVAQAYASQAGVKIKTVEAKHETFSYGDNQWDLIVCSYCYLMPTETQWADVFYRALRPGGVVVFQTSVGTRATAQELAAIWKKFRILRVEDVDAGVVDDDWAPSRTNPTAKLVARKE